MATLLVAYAIVWGSIAAYSGWLVWGNQRLERRRKLFRQPTDSELHA